VFDHFRFSPRSQVLELGCGPGRLWQENLERTPSGWEILLTDASVGMVNEARGYLAGRGHHVHFAVLDTQWIPCSNGAFDAVIANHMLYHVADLPMALSEIYRVLRHGGLFYAATNGPTHMRELSDLIGGFDADLLNVWHQPRQGSVFDLEGGGECLSQWFSEVRMDRYDDSLNVTEALPVLAYLSSMTRMREPIRRCRDAFLEYVEERLATSGPLRITKDQGLFTAIRS
jgi:SAM-dependent methyltransferase